METPTYPPAAAYEAPVMVPYKIGTRTCSAGELMRIPAAWAIVLKHMPMAKMMAGSPMVQAQLYNMTFADFGVFSNFDNSATLDAIDAELATLSPADRNAQ